MKLVIEIADHGNSHLESTYEVLSKTRIHPMYSFICIMVVVYITADQLK